jgi:PHD/YefM family antitoxin component YafN of YafNO toxin-antitoxin module
MRDLLTSRGKPKAALVSMADYERLEHERAAANLVQWQTWVEDAAELASAILNRRNREPLDVDALWQKARAEMEARDAQTSGR